VTENTATITAPAIALGHSAGHRRMPGHQRRFARHFGEMMLAMVLGMVVLGSAIELALGVAGESLEDASAPLMASVMAFTMTVPMVAWMHYRHRMPVGRSIEMTASMVIPTIVAIALYGLAAISSETVLIVQHAVMVPAMLAVMLWKYDAYAHSH
jgi:hypothetical protein